MRLRVDVDGLASLAGDVGSVAGRFADGTDLLPAAARAACADGPVAASLATAVVGRHHALEQLRALQVVLRVVAQSYAATEARVAALMSGASAGWGEPPRGGASGLGRLLGRTDPVALEGLLVAVPGLAAAVARDERLGGGGGEAAADVRLRDELTRTLLLAPGPAALAQARLLTALDPARRRRFALLHPRLLGALAAAPPQDRFAASRVLVAADLADLLALHGRAAPGRARDVITARVALRQRLLTGQVVLRHPDDTTTRHPHQLLRFDPAGDGGLVEVIGDLRRARHLAFFVPGTGSDLPRYPGSLARTTPFAAADPAVAVVLWQGADHPDQPFDDPFDPVTLLPPHDVTDALRDYARRHVVAAAYRDAADLAGPVLAADVAGLRLAAPAAGGDVTVLGHSYGGSIVGSAEARGMVVDRVVHIASAGGYVDDVSRYASPTGPQRFSMTAFDDPIRLSQGHTARDASQRLDDLLPWALDPLAPVAAPVATAALGAEEQIGHGIDPDLLPGVVRLDTGVHPDGSLVRGHSGMFDPGSSAWQNLLAVMARGRVHVLEPGLWSSHLEPLGAEVTVPSGVLTLGGSSVRVRPPRYVVDRSPYDVPGYRPPVMDLGPSDAPGQRPPVADPRRPPVDRR